MWQSPITFLINGGMNALLKQGMVKCITLCQKPMLHMRRYLKGIKTYPSNYLPGYCLLRLP